MTSVVINDILPRTQAVATAGQTVYSTSWTANAATDIQVYSRATGVDADDATQILSYSTDYTVAFVGGGQTVQVTLLTPSTLGDIVTIIRNTPSDRVNFYSNTNFTPQMLNNDFGILTLVDQQAQLVNQEIAPRYNYSELLNQTASTEDVILPLLGANQAWVKNAGNTAIVPITIPGGVIPPSTATFITQATEASLPNSFKLLAGNGLGFTLGAGTLTVGITAPVSLANGGTNAVLSASNKSLVYSNTTGFALLSTANNGALVTDSGGTPSISSTLPTAVQGNITQLGAQSQALNMNSHLINNLSTPIAATDAATKAYADSIAGGLNPIPGVQAATTANLTATYNNGTAGVGATLTNSGAMAAFAVDGYSASLNDRILIKNQTSTFQNGIYTVTTVGSGAANWVLTRATDYDTTSQIKPGDLTVIENGTVNKNASYLETAVVVTIGTDAITFSPFFTPSTYLQVANNLSDVNNANTSFNNISPLTTKGDLLGFSTVNARLAVGSDGQILQAASGATVGLAWSTPTYPSTSGSAGQILRSDGTNNVYSTATYPNTAGTSGHILTSDGTNWNSTAPSGTGTVQLISTVVASSQAAVAFTGLSSTYSYYYVVYDGVLPLTNNVNLIMRVSTNNGSTYSSSGYYYAINVTTSGGSNSPAGGAGVGQFVLTSGQSNATSNTASGFLEIYNPSQSTNYQHINNRAIQIDSSGGVDSISGGGVWLTTTAVNAIQFSFSSGNISTGTFKLYGVLA